MTSVLDPDDRYHVMRTERSDLDFVFGLFELSIRYQESHGYPVWKNYDKSAIIKDIGNGNQYKIVSGSEAALVFSVGYDDKIIWRDRDKGKSIYLHRIVVNPKFKGQRLFGLIVGWAVSHCKERNLESIRLDTWASNATITGYYESFGFRFVENYVTPDTEGLPAHNRNLALTLLELKV